MAVDQAIPAPALGDSEACAEGAASLEHQDSATDPRAPLSSPAEMELARRDLSSLPPPATLAKRAVDLLLAAAALVVLLPVLIVIGIAIRVDSPGPAVFRQERVGQRLRPFRILKFRTMVDGAHDQRHALSDRLCRLE